MRKKKSALHYYTIGSLLLLLSSSIIAWLFHAQYQREVKQHLGEHLTTLQMQFNATASHYRLIADSMFENVINRPHITSLMAQAVDASEQERDRLRRQLHAELTPLYTYLKGQDIRHFHFHLPGAVSFLRFHRPDKYGDDLSDIRPSIVRVNATKQTVYDFEEGRALNGFRNLFPLFHEGKFVGSVELSYPFRALRTDALRTLDAHYHAIFKRDIIQKKVWEDERRNYAVSSLSPAYFYDRQARESCQNDAGISDNTIARINGMLEDADGRLAKAESFVTAVTMDEHIYSVAFIPIINIQKRLAGYFVTYQIDTHIQEMHTIAMRLALITGLGNALIILLLVLYLRSGQIRHETLEMMATTDALTSIPNRMHLMMVLQHELSTSRRYGHALSLIFFDVDHFKRINDTFGHDTGDRVLIELAKCVGAHIRKSDLFARWGGEEFAIVLPSTGIVRARELAEKLRRIIETHPFPKSEVTASFGVAELEDEDDDAALMKRADTLLYRAKEHGRNRVESGRS